MSYLVKGAHQALTKRLNRAIRQIELGQRPRYGPGDLEVFCYIRDEISPEGLERRAGARLPEEDTNIQRLHDAANERLSHYEEES